MNAAGSASYEMEKWNVLHYSEAGKATAAFFFLSRFSSWKNINEDKAILGFSFNMQS